MLAAVASASCSGPAPGPPVEEQLAAARQAFVEFDFVTARDGFATVLEQEPGNTEAAYGHARTLRVLNQFDEAVPAFERALELAPDDPRVHEGYVATLAAGGALRGRRAWLDRTIEAGGEAIRAFPERVQPYEAVERAVGELNQRETWLQLLGALAPEVGESPVFRVHHIQARLAAARSAGDRERTAAIEEELRQELAAAAATEDPGESEAPPDPGRHYLLAIGHGLLGDGDRERTWLTRLEDTPEGRHMGAGWIHFEVFYRDFVEAEEAPLDERLQIIERWKERFQPAWETDDITYYGAPLSEELALLIEEARRQGAEEGRPNDELLDRIVANGEKLVRLDTSGSVRHYEQISQLLIGLEARLDEALRFADEGIAGLREARPGLLYPGLQDDELERARQDWFATLERVRGLALAAMGRAEEAEDAFLRAIDISPRSDCLAALGELLAARGRDKKAYATLVAALAHNAEDDRIATDSARVRDRAIEAATRLGRDEAALDVDIETTRTEVADVARRRLVEDRLDRDAPDFALTDAEGNEWRLSDLRGSVVVLNYWATWCAPCVKEFPHYRELIDSYAAADDVIFLAITTNTDHSKAHAFLEENDYRFTVLFDEGSATDFHVTGIPAHFILGPEGRIQYATTGFTDPERYDREMRWRIEALRQK